MKPEIVMRDELGYHKEKLFADTGNSGGRE